jgi:CheY-like chemotaxis protein
LRAKNIEIDASYASMVPDAKVGSFVVIEVSDTGTGIPPELRDQIFEAFFTTKAEGHGTGLGLSTVRSIVQEHGGFVTVQSETGNGTTFRVFLPAAFDELPDAEIAKPNASPRDGDREWILVVDDEASIRTIMQTVLETHGYQVLAAAEGAEAVAIYAQNSTRIAAVVTDIVMPFMDGVALIGALRRINPGVKVIATSGFAEKARMAALESLKLPALLAKPYSAMTLITALSTLLRGGQTDAGQPVPEAELLPVEV